MQPPVYNDVRVAREVRLPRLVPRKTRMNLRLDHEQQAEMVAEFNPGLEDPYFGARDRCRCAGWVQNLLVAGSGLAGPHANMARPSTLPFLRFPLHIGTFGWPCISSRGGRLIPTSPGQPHSVRPPARCCCLPSG